MTSDARLPHAASRAALGGRVMDSKALVRRRTRIRTEPGGRRVLRNAARRLPHREPQPRRRVLCNPGAISDMCGSHVRSQRADHLGLDRRRWAHAAPRLRHDGQHLGDTPHPIAARSSTRTPGTCRHWTIFDIAPLSPTDQTIPARSRVLRNAARWRKAMGESGSAGDEATMSDRGGGQGYFCFRADLHKLDPAVEERSGRARPATRRAFPP